MEHSHLNEMIKGWFVGDFNPTLFATKDFEVAVKNYKSGETEAEHFHKMATEITVVVSGRVEMCNRIWGEGSIIKLLPGEATSFLALEDAITVVVKTPSVIGDKYEN
jgi:quercetin dioxygenase-like cupin family protein